MFGEKDPKKSSNPHIATGIFQPRIFLQEKDFSTLTLLPPKPTGILFQCKNGLGFQANFRDSHIQVFLGFLLKCLCTLTDDKEKVPYIKNV